MWEGLTRVEQEETEITGGHLEDQVEQLGHTISFLSMHKSSVKQEFLSQVKFYNLPKIT